MIKSLLLKLATPILQKVFNVEPPIVPSSQTTFPTVASLPGKMFKPAIKAGSYLSEASGKINILPGDCSIPVLTYCMKSNASSPNAHRYTLAKLQGSRAQVISDLNLRAFPKYSQQAIQTLSWSIQNGIPYERFSDNSKKIADEFLPEHKERLSKDFLTQLEENWNKAARLIPGMPNADQAVNLAIENLGEAGQWLKEIKNIRDEVRRNGASYETFANPIDLPGLSKIRGDEDSTPWSQLNQNTYGRFLTSGHFGDLGVLQFRNNSTGTAEIDPVSLVADPGTGSIQPLSFTPLIAGAGAIPITVGMSPAVIAALVAAALAAQNWDYLVDAVNKIASVTDRDVADLLNQLGEVFSEKHNAMEQPARELGVLDGAKEIKEGGFEGARNYEKPGGSKARDADFEKFPGEAKEVEPGVKIKTLPNGNKVASRGSSSGPATLEIQPPIRKNPSIKIRYPE